MKYYSAYAVKNTNSFKWFLNGFLFSVAITCWLEIDYIVEGILRIINII